MRHREPHLGVARTMRLMLIASALLITVVAQAQEYQLTIGWAGAGTVEVDGVAVTLPYTATYSAGTTVSLDPVPIPHWGFHRWTGDVLPANIFSVPLQVTINQDTTITPHFQRIEQLLTVEWAAGGNVMVNGTPRSLPFSAYFPTNCQVVLDVIPGECWIFQRWTGDVAPANITDDPLTLTMSADLTVRPNFIQQTSVLNIASAAAGTVTVNGNPVQLPYSARFPCNAVVTVDAIPNDCFVFDQWSGDIAEGDRFTDPLQLSMAEDRSIRPHFRWETFTLQVLPGMNGSAIVNGTPRALPYSENFRCNQVVTVEAVPNNCWEFSSWTGDVPVGAGNPAQIVMDQDRTIQPTFVQAQYDLTIQWAGAGSIMVNGAPVTLPYTATYDCNQVVNIDPVPNDCWQFQRWTGDVPFADRFSDPLALRMDQDRTIRPNFQMIRYTLSIAEAMQGSVRVNGSEVALPYNAQFACGTTVVIDAVPRQCWLFDRWTGDVPAPNVSDDPLTLTMDQNRSIDAHFAQQQFELSIGAGLFGSVEVNGSPATLPFSQLFDCNSVVTVEVFPIECRQFSQWLGDVPDGDRADNPLQLTMNQDRSILPAFVSMRYDLTIERAPAGSVTVNGEPVTLPYTGTFLCNDVVRIAPSPNDPCWEFQRWTGDVPAGDINNDPLMLVMDQDRTIKPNFQRKLQTLTLNGSNGRVLVNGTARTLPYTEDFRCGDAVTLQAVANECWQFTQWTGDIPAANNANNPVQVVMDQDRTIQPAFAQMTYDLTIEAAAAGTVTVNGAPVSLPFTATYNCNEVVNIDAIPNSCWQLDRWTGDVPAADIRDDPLALTMNQDRTIKPNFRRIRYDLNIAAAANGSAMVNGVTQALPYSASFLCNTVVTVCAVPDVGFQFVRWTGDLPGSVEPTNLTIQLTMDQTRTITPSFESVSGTTSMQMSSVSAVPSAAGVEVVFTLSAPASVSAEVMNMAGRTIRHIVLDREYGPGPQSVAWNGMSDYGTKAPSGPYLVRVTARSGSGECCERLSSLQIR